MALSIIVVDGGLFDLSWSLGCYLGSPTWYVCEHMSLCALLAHPVRYIFLHYMPTSGYDLQLKLACGQPRTQVRLQYRTASYTQPHLTTPHTTLGCIWGAGRGEGGHFAIFSPSPLEKPHYIDHLEDFASRLAPDFLNLQPWPLEGFYNYSTATPPHPMCHTSPHSMPPHLTTLHATPPHPLTPLPNTHYRCVLHVLHIHTHWNPLESEMRNCPEYSVSLLSSSSGKVSLV